MNQKTINEAADAYASTSIKNGDNQISEDFKAGVKWCQEQFENEEARTDRNMELICSFIDHYKVETGNEIPEEIMLSFFNA